ncbi:tetratricopeptide repeat protein [Flagellimonas sp. HMM57]|uniref:tetratricopeptide repeat protein n=1 Tax=unclassified Flagellimonas TaxID=2644544 RepID=UPI0013D82800|nr:MULTISPECIES: tetratricopeptide repeat protein [unclassified Flagellimonas]UII77974.1 tetratricopeptide repeat protein [Flagellimonas sp. HMM57]
MYKIRLLLSLLLLTTITLKAQDEIAEKEAEESLRASKNLTWEANKELTKNDFITAEADYRKAISKSGENAVAPFNLGNAYYNRENYQEAFGRFKQAGETAESKPEKHKSYHNMGNVFMKNKEYQKAVEAYKEALRNNPTDEETRYNLALAKEMLKKQQDEQKNDQNQDDKDKKNEEDQKDKNQDQDDKGENDKENEGDQNEDENKDDGDEGDKGENKPEENKEGEGDKKEEQKKKPNEGDQPQEQKQQPRPNQLSKQQIQNLLEAMQNEEKKVQEKMEAKKVKGKKIKNEKDW